MKADGAAVCRQRTRTTRSRRHDTRRDHTHFCLHTVALGLCEVGEEALALAARLDCERPRYQMDD